MPSNQQLVRMREWIIMLQAWEREADAWMVEAEASGDPEDYELFRPLSESIERAKLDANFAVTYPRTQDEPEVVS